jgi:hypothetical protein
MRNPNETMRRRIVGAAMSLALISPFVILCGAGASAAEAADGQTPPSGSVAGAEPSARLQLGVGGLFGAPSGSIGDAVGWTGGFSADLGFHFRRVPLVLAAELHIESYSRLPTGVVKDATPEVVIDGPAGNSALGGYLVVRLQRKRRGVRPYLDGAIGIQWTGIDLGDDIETPALLQTERSVSASAEVSWCDWPNREAASTLPTWTCVPATCIPDPRPR